MRHHSCFVALPLFFRDVRPYRPNIRLRPNFVEVRAEAEYPEIRPKPKPNVRSIPAAHCTVLYSRKILRITSLWPCLSSSRRYRRISASASSVFSFINLSNIRLASGKNIFVPKMHIYIDIYRNKGKYSGSS